MSPHLGAHADAPLHYGRAPPRSAGVDLDPFLGPCRVMHAIDGALIKPEHLAHAASTICRRASWCGPASGRRQAGRRTFRHSPPRRSRGWPAWACGWSASMRSRSIPPTARHWTATSSCWPTTCACSRTWCWMTSSRRLRVDRAAPEAGARAMHRRCAPCCDRSMIAREPTAWRAMPPIRWRRCAEQFALERSTSRASIYLDGNSLGVLPKATPARCSRSSRRMGPRPDSQLEHRGLDHAVAAHRRQDRAPHRRRAGRGRGRRLDLDQSLQGAERRGGERGRGRRSARRRRGGHRVGAHELSHRPLHRRHARARARIRARARR